MADLEQRVTRLEERSEAQTATMDYLRQDMSDLRRSTEGARKRIADRNGVAATKHRVARKRLCEPKWRHCARNCATGWHL